MVLVVVIDLLRLCFPVWGCFLFECGAVAARDFSNFLVHSQIAEWEFPIFGSGKNTGGRQSIPYVICKKQF